MTICPSFFGTGVARPLCRGKAANLGGSILSCLGTLIRWFLARQFLCVGLRFSQTDGRGRGVNRRTDPPCVMRPGVNAGQHAKSGGRPLEDRLLAELAANGTCLVPVEPDQCQSRLYVPPCPVATGCWVLLQHGVSNPCDQ
jgi:hypothetical protein